ncbi:MAG: hypothetical protein NTY35_06110 [Planctomycetota bacterium]|nr:hypothetical protein [Planctomycetota bacterium]
MGSELETFHRDASHVFTLESGSRGPCWYGQFRMHVSFRPPSRAMVDVSVFVPDDQPDPFEARFRAEVEPAALNELGRRLRSRVASDRARLVCPPEPDD